MPTAISATCLVLLSILYLYLRLRKGARARTANEFFFFDKQVNDSQYFDTTVSYSLQVVVTMFFIYWGFVYGIGMFYYALVWFVGIYLFQISAPRLIKFANSEDTLHGFLEKEYGSSRAIRRITAGCTLLGLTGSLLIEVSLTTDVLDSLGSSARAGSIWMMLFFALLFIGWLYVTYGGYKSAVLAYAIQLPIVYATLAFALCYLLWMIFHAGYFRHALFIAICIFLLWSVIVLARVGGMLRISRLDNATAVALVAAAGTLIATLAFVCVYAGTGNRPEAVSGSADSFSLAAFRSQDYVVLIGFTLLNLGTQFCDMTAWQRISSLDLAGPSRTQIEQLKRVIAETKWESPATWGFGIVLGIALRHSGIFHSNHDAFGAMTSFIGYLAHDQTAGWLAAYMVLPCIVVAFASIMYSTIDALLATVIYTWIVDISGVHRAASAQGYEGDSIILRRARVGSFMILFVAASIFALLHRGLHVNIFLILNTIASAQFAIAFLSVGALYLPSPKRFGRIAIATATAALLSNFATALYCYIRMSADHNRVWEDWFYALPTIGSGLGGFLAFLILTLLFRRGEMVHAVREYI